MNNSFHGSYRPEQVQFLLKPIEVTPIADTAAKEALIQSGQKHYSEMLSPEYPPSARYLALFHAALAANGAAGGHRRWVPGCSPRQWPTAPARRRNAP